MNNLRRNNFEKDIESIILETLNNDKQSSEKLTSAEFDGSEKRQILSSTNNLANDSNKQRNRSVNKYIIFSIVSLALLFLGITLVIICYLNDGEFDTKNHNFLENDKGKEIAITSSADTKEKSVSTSLITTTTVVTDRSNNIEIRVDNQETATTRYFEKKEEYSDSHYYSSTTKNKEIIAPYAQESTVSTTMATQTETTAINNNQSNHVYDEDYNGSDFIIY